MPYDQIELEMQGLIKDGFREVVLSGINLGDYKTEDGLKFVDALRLIDEKSGDMRSIYHCNLAPKSYYE
jgi:tRNA A37 methylthiotransferase MiaB